MRCDPTPTMRRDAARLVADARNRHKGALWHFQRKPSWHWTKLLRARNRVLNAASHMAGSFKQLSFFRRQHATSCKCFMRYKQSSPLRFESFDEILLVVPLLWRCFKLGRVLFLWALRMKRRLRRTVFLDAGSTVSFVHHRSIHASCFLARYSASQRDKYEIKWDHTWSIAVYVFIRRKKGIIEKRNCCGNTQFLLRTHPYK